MFMRMFIIFTWIFLGTSGAGNEVSGPMQPEENIVIEMGEDDAAVSLHP